MADKITMDLMAYLWAGTEDGFHAYQSQQQAIEQRITKASSEILLLADAWEEEKDDEPEDTHWLLQRYGDIGVISINGTLVEGSVNFWSWRAATGYEDIRNATIAAMNSGCKAIINNFNTPGGMVRGIGSCSDFLQYANSVIPIHSHTSSQCCSGGVWLATAPGRFTASKDAEVGSIGVMQVATEITKMDQEYGITRKVFKSAPLKGLGNPYEKLGAAQSAEIDRMITNASDKFNAQVTTGLKLDPNYVKQTLATGQVWFGDEARDLQLVQKNITLDQLVVDLQKKVSQNKPTNPSGTLNQPANFTASALSTETGDMKKKTLNSTMEDALAKAAETLALANGATAGDPAEDEPAPDENGDPVPDPVEEEEAEGSEAKAGNVSGLEKLAATVNDLSEKLIASRVELATIKAENANLQIENTTLKSTDAQFKSIAAEAIQWATVAVGGTPPNKDSLVSMASTLLIKQHAETMATMTQRFGDGGRKSSSEEEGAETEDDLVAAAQKMERDVLMPLSRFSNKK